jgi:sterol desaturase/sphingolipid hydroxylase (fatty acid hydroxylase superfamily)
VTTDLTLVGAFCGGAFLWTFCEYVLHRWFHVARGSNLASSEHLRHHARRLYRVNAISWLAWAGVFIVGLGAMPIVTWVLLPYPVALAIGAGWVVAYFVYEGIHAVNHLRAPHTAYGRWTRKSHFHHHFGAPMKNFGVTVPLWDLVFRTYESPTAVVVPRRLAMVWLLDENGEVRAEHRRDYVVRGTRTEIGPEEIVDAFANRIPSAA